VPPEAVPVAAKLPYKSTCPATMPEKSPLNVPCILPSASIVIENVPLIDAGGSVICPDQVPVSDPWKTLGFGVWVLVVGVVVEVIVDVGVWVLVASVAVEVIVDVGVWVLVTGVVVEVIVDVGVWVLVAGVAVEVIVDVRVVVREISVLLGLGHPRKTKIIIIITAITMIPINKTRRLRFINKSSIRVSRHH
jgi:hypothetical protein